MNTFRLGTTIVLGTAKKGEKLLKHLCSSVSGPLENLDSEPLYQKITTSVKRGILECSIYVSRSSGIDGTSDHFLLSLSVRLKHLYTLYFLCLAFLPFSQWVSFDNKVWQWCAGHYKNITIISALDLFVLHSTNSASHLHSICGYLYSFYQQPFYIICSHCANCSHWFQITINKPPNFWNVVIVLSLFNELQCIM